MATKNFENQSQFDELMSRLNETRQELFLTQERNFELVNEVRSLKENLEKEQENLQDEKKKHESVIASLGFKMLHFENELRKEEREIEKSFIEKDNRIKTLEEIITSFQTKLNSNTLCRNCFMVKHSGYIGEQSAAQENFQAKFPLELDYEDHKSSNYDVRGRSISLPLSLNQPENLKSGKGFYHDLSPVPEELESSLLDHAKKFNQSTIIEEEEESGDEADKDDGGKHFLKEAQGIGGLHDSESASKEIVIENTKNEEIGNDEMKIRDIPLDNELFCAEGKSEDDQDNSEENSEQQRLSKKAEHFVATVSDFNDTETLSVEDIKKSKLDEHLESEKVCEEEIEKHEEWNAQNPTDNENIDSLLESKIENHISNFENNDVIATSLQVADSNSSSHENEKACESKTATSSQGSKEVLNEPVINVAKNEIADAPTALTSTPEYSASTDDNHVPLKGDDIMKKQSQFESTAPDNEDNIKAENSAEDDRSLFKPWLTTPDGILGSQVQSDQQKLETCSDSSDYDVIELE